MSFDLAPHAYFTLPDGGKLRYARFEPATAPRGTVLIVPGRREFIEKKVAELGQPLLDRGYRLILFEPRGQGLSSRFLAGDRRQRDYVEDFSIFLNDLRAFFAAHVQPDLAGPLILHGHSLGGHCLLRWLAEDRPAVAGAFVTAPMMALAGVPAHLTAFGISWVSNRLFGAAVEYAPTQQDFGSEERAFAHNPLTQDPVRFKIMEDYFDAYPDMKVGGVTWGWLLAALKSMQIVQNRSYLARIEAPVLALIGGNDRVTPAQEVGHYANNIPRVQTHIIGGARHDLLNEITPYRAEAWGYIEGFLKKINPD